MVKYRLKNNLSRRCLRDKIRITCEIYLCKTCVICEICGLYHYTYKLNLRFRNFKLLFLPLDGGG